MFLARRSASLVLERPTRASLLRSDFSGEWFLSFPASSARCGFDSSFFAMSLSFWIWGWSGGSQHGRFIRWHGPQPSRLVEGICGRTLDDQRPESKEALGGVQRTRPGGTNTYLASPNQTSADLARSTTRWPGYLGFRCREGVVQVKEAQNPSDADQTIHNKASIFLAARSPCRRAELLSTDRQEKPPSCCAS